MHCPTCGGVDNYTQSYCQSCGTNLKVVREALETTAAEQGLFSGTVQKDLQDERSAKRTQVLKRANILQIIRFSLSLICNLVPLLVLGGLATSGILLNQPVANLIIWISILAFGLGIAFDWELGRYLV